jgi:hypothetical protein
VAKQPVTNVNEFNAAIQKADKKEVLLRVHSIRDKRSGYVVVKSDD